MLHNTDNTYGIVSKFCAILVCCSIRIHCSTKLIAVCSRINEIWVDRTEIAHLNLSQTIELSYPYLTPIYEAETIIYIYDIHKVSLQNLHDLIILILADWTHMSLFEMECQELREIYMSTRSSYSNHPTPSHTSGAYIWCRKWNRNWNKPDISIGLISKYNTLPTTLRLNLPSQIW